MAELLAELGSGFTAMIGNVGIVASTIVSTPLLLIPSAAFLTGVSIKFFKKML